MLQACRTLHQTRKGVDAERLMPRVQAKHNRTRRAGGAHGLSVCAAQHGPERQPGYRRPCAGLEAGMLGKHTHENS
jgi:hypothetical protein